MIGVDIGGTKVLAVKFLNGKAVKKIRFGKIRNKNEIERIFEKIVKKFRENKVGVGVPGKVKNKKVIFSPNLPPLDGLNFAEIEKKMEIEIFVENDANCFAWGEFLKRKGKLKNLVGITIGTGIGGGIIINGKLWKGNSFAGEIGHMSIKFDGRKCRCGNFGCAEEYLSERAIQNLSLKFLRKKLTPKEVYSLAKNGNKNALKIFEIEGKFLGILISNLQNVLGIDNFVIGGGISNAYRFMKKSMEKELRIRCKISRIPKVFKGNKLSVAYGASQLVK